MSTLVKDLGRLTVRSISVSEMDNNVYLITAKRSGAQVLIDAADDLPAIQELLADGAEDAAEPAQLALIATTHQHWDHVRALEGLVEATGAPVAAGRQDVAGIPVPVSVVLDHGDVGNFDGFDLTAVHLRGHTPGSIAYVLEEEDAPPLIFSGDSLFPGGVGNTQKDADRFALLYGDVVDRLFTVYPDESEVYPGHGRPTTLGAERPHLGEWLERGW
ncbi:Zn-dependent hydrolase [Sinomonas cellulolyticus]|uniref:MBL fold metallo-hydrolase n=1 Tax=Sinomonas cellulolyticus TaxID=2801916 RepID=A0ABS1K514_9MICC|nr:MULTISPECIES: MBL fold metallo-hydrolase [Sinomonas]MBL0705371.1 MBL fold metallo-hydrolase [Sinomonas cellulolyticus]GHG40825.1 Zn-dependent hydrolase [Sinomonas sp. KCTC 49339]